MSVGSVLFSLLFFSLYLPFSRAAVARYPRPDDLAGFLGLFLGLIGIDSQTGQARFAFGVPPEPVTSMAVIVLSSRLSVTVLPASAVPLKISVASPVMRSEEEAPVSSEAVVMTGVRAPSEVMTIGTCHLAQVTISSSNRALERCTI